MALFKILRGDAKNLVELPVKDGYAYFTPDDGRFYIDVTDQDGVKAEVGAFLDKEKGINRICINDFHQYIFDCGNAFMTINSSVVPPVITVSFVDNSNVLNQAYSNYPMGATIEDDVQVIKTIVYNCGKSKR